MGPLGINNIASNDWNDLNHDTREAGYVGTFKKLIKGRGQAYSNLYLVVLASLWPVNNIFSNCIVGLKEDI